MSPSPTKAPLRRQPGTPLLVCLECHSSYDPTVQGLPAKVLISNILMVVVLVIGIVVGSQAQLTEGWAHFWAVQVAQLPVFLIRFVGPRVNTLCRACGTGRVVPSTTPRGREILAKTQATEP